jgi:hypothetical protein
MKKYKNLAEFFADQDTKTEKQINLVRDLIFKAEPSLTETLKWNAPNYVYKGADRITFNLMNKEHKVKVLIHMGTAKKENKAGEPILNDASRIVSWNSDIRGTITFEDETDVKAKSTAFKKVVREWLKL